MIRPTALIFLVSVIASLAAANPILVPLVETIESQPIEEVSLTIVPDGSGTPFSAAWGIDGNPVDAILRVYLVDDQHVPLYGIPAEYLWLQFDEGAGTADGCVHDSYYGGIFNPNGDSDDNGMIEWVLPLCGGGWSVGPARLYFLGMPLMTPDYEELPPFPIRVNSPDISGDLEVDLTDITLFTQDLGGAYNYRSDLHWDGVIDLSDIVIFAQGIGATCP